ncbi:hypothetical protein QW180_01215 [Vibrio sinaloensis]|nr:hypothetical protein [Vibrio sinaloensis]
MLPRLNSQSDVDPIVLKFLDTLRQSGFSGDIESQYSSRLAVATDNSVYQQLPQAVVHPKSTKDVTLIGKLSNHSDYERITFFATRRRHWNQRTVFNHGDCRGPITTHEQGVGDQ